MTSLQTRPGPVVVAAMLCSAALSAQLVGGKAARDALFLAQLNVTSLPYMVIATSLCSIVLVIASSKAIARLTPAVFVPLAFWASAVLFLIEWLLTAATPRIAPVVVYLHMSGLGPVLASGFWLIATESFDPRTAKKRFGHIAGAGTLGGICGGLFAERAGWMFGVTAVLPFLAALNILGALAVRRLARTPAAGIGAAPPPSRSLGPESVQSGLRVFSEVPYIRHLAALVLLGTMSAALLDYIFKVQAVQTFGRGEQLLRFFAIYYTATSVITFVVQASSSRFLLQRFGLALATSLPSLAVFGGSVLSLIVPEFRTIIGARGAETVFRGSLFRFGYELFYTPIPAAQKRSVKSIIDVGFDRLGDAVGAGIIRIVLVFAPVAQYSILLFLGIASSAAAVVLASRLNRGYIHTLEHSLLNRAVEFDLSDVQDRTTRTTMMRTIGHRSGHFEPGLSSNSKAPPQSVGMVSSGDPEIQEIILLRSRDREKVSKVLRRDEGITAALVPHVIPLLAWGPVAADAVFALRKVAEERVGEFADVLVDPNQEFAVRRRLARVFSVCSSQRAADTLMLGLDDLRFEVRFQCGRSLSAILERNPRVRIDRERVLEVILREVAVGRPVWASRRLLDGLESTDDGSFVDEFVRERAGQSLAHVFTLLSLVLPRDPLLIAFRGLQTGDQNLRGTALEYLEGVLPPDIRERLWPFLEDGRPPSRSTRPRDEILGDLLRSNRSIMLNLEDLKRRDDDKRFGSAEPASVSSTGANPFDPGAS